MAFKAVQLHNFDGACPSFFFAVTSPGFFYAAKRMDDISLLAENKKKKWKNGKE
jgi:hypothetical protein